MVITQERLERIKELQRRIQNAHNVPQKKQVLCFTRNYIQYYVPFAQVKEVISRERVEEIPMLPDIYCGVCPYQNEMIPVYRNANAHKVGERCVILIIESLRGYKGILLEELPEVMDANDPELGAMVEYNDWE